jgi:7,8-dihydro-6-hydroxymethylpterin dimethyltransferase
VPTRKYTYYDFTLSLCPECLKRVDAKIVFEDDKVYMLKRCPEHGQSKVLIADDIAYYKNIRNYNKPSEHPIHSIQKLTTDARMIVGFVRIMSNIPVSR